MHIFMPNYSWGVKLISQFSLKDSIILYVQILAVPNSE